MKKYINTFKKPIIAIGAVLTTFIVFGALIPQLGFYQDDWYLIWSGQARGAASIIELFKSDRPFMGYIYSIDYQLLGNSIIGWHVYALLLKALGVLGIWKLYTKLWPKQSRTTFIAIMIFIVYPGFLSQPIANTFQNHLLTYAAAIWSIVFGVLTIFSQKRTHKWLYVVFSLVLTAFYLPIYEYMVGLEAIKIVFFGLAIYHRDGKSINRTIKQAFTWYFPHGIIALLFLFWRLFVFQSTRPTTDQSALLANFVARPLQALVYLLINTAKGFINTVFHAWSITSYRLTEAALYRELGEALLWTAPVIVFCILVIRYCTDDEHRTENNRNDLVILGLWAVVVAIFPVIASGREILFTGFERYTLQASLGVSLLITGILSYVRPRLREVALLVLIFIGTTSHILNARTWANVWERHQDIYWQVSWRVPDFRDDALVIVSNFGIEQDYEAWVPLNLIYAPSASSPTIDAELMYSGAVGDIQAGNLSIDSGRIELIKNFDNVVIFTKPSSLSCLHVIDGELPILSEFESPLVANVARFSDLGQIIEESQRQAVVPPEIFGREPDRGWCYYYQKMSFARQTYDWRSILELASQADANDLRPTDRSEWMPVFEAMVNEGLLEQARQPASILRSVSDLKISICNSLITNEEKLRHIDVYDYINVLDILCTEWDE